MADNTLKKIEEIKRGDLVLTVNGPLPVCRVIKESLGSKVSLCKIPKGSIDGKIPYNDLYVCSRHVVRYNNKRRLATSLRGFKDVQILSGSRTEIVPNIFYIYDLQFETETYYYAEGLESQSRSPYCRLSPLPKELYFNKGLYKDIKVSDCLSNEKFENNWPNVYNKFSWRTYLAKYILLHPEKEFKSEDFTEEKALQIRSTVDENIDLSEIIPEDFNWKEYISANRDLQQFKNEMEACLHWMNFGHTENRYYKYYPYV